jgi:N-ethylmaleimide reductase
MAESDPAATYAALLDGLAPLGLAYLHVVEGPATHVHDALRAQWQGTFLLNTGFTGSSERDALAAEVAAGRADLVSVGRLLLANPDLVERWRAGAELNTPQDATFYGGDERGYTDYPTLDGASA